MVFGSSNGYAGSSIDAPAFFTKEGEQSQLRPLNPGEYWTPYLSLREDSLHHREQGVDGAMETLYNFWSSFLVDKFNAGMYQDFKTLAINDLSSGSEDGVQYLMKYYQKALKGSRPLSDAVASDLVSFLRDEPDGKDRVFKMMRIAWRDGALNLKTRKRIGDHLSDEEKAGFDKGG
jgi:la-related protein 1